MKVKSLAANQTEVITDNVTVFVSYETPVAAFVSGSGILRTEKKWSATTSRHINQWIAKNHPTATQTVVPQAEIEGLLQKTS